MKRVELLGLSVVAAALIMTTGCSSSSDKKASGPSAPSEVTKSAEMNISTAQKALTLAHSGNNLFSSPKLAAIRASMKAMVAGNSSSSGSGTETYPCELGGAVTRTWNNYSTNNEDGSWTDGSTDNFSFDDCLYSANEMASNDELMNIYAIRGSYTVTHTAEFDNGGQLYKESFSLDDNYSSGFENNETSTSQISSYNFAYSETHEDKVDESTGTNTTTYYYKMKGYGHEGIESNSTGSVYNGQDFEADITFTQNTTDDGIVKQEKHTSNGFSATYDINATGRKVTESSYFSNYVEEFTSMGDDTNISITGKRGNLCLDGSVTYATTMIIQENEVDYQDENNNSNNGNVLPYKGVLTISGTGAATATFDNNGTHSSVNIVSGDVNETFYQWNTLAVGSCGR